MEKVCYRHESTHTTTRVRLREGEVLPTVHFRPIGKSEVWEMASLARDYNPLHLLSGSEGSKAPSELHSLWLTSLVELGIRSLIPGAVVVELVMDYGRPAQMGHAPALSATVVSVGEAGGTASLSLSIEGPKGEILATGRARIGLSDTAKDPDPGTG